MIGFEEQMRPARLCNRVAVDHDANVALARHHIDALVRIARMLEKLLFFFHPLVHFRPIESKVVFQAGRLGARSRITPRRVFGAAIADLDRPI